MLIFHLKKEWYEKIKSGEKTVEYRECKPYWYKRLFSARALSFQNMCWDNIREYIFPAESYFQLGYKPETRIRAFITFVEIVDGKNTDLKIDKDVYAIHFKLVKE